MYTKTSKNFNPVFDVLRHREYGNQFKIKSNSSSCFYNYKIYKNTTVKLFKLSDESSDHKVKYNLTVVREKHHIEEGDKKILGNFNWSLKTFVGQVPLSINKTAKSTLTWQTI